MKLKIANFDEVLPENAESYESDSAYNAEVTDKAARGTCSDALFADRLREMNF